MKIDRTGFSVTDYPEVQDNPWLERLLGALSRHSNGVQQALTQQLSFSDNFNAELRTVEVKVPADIRGYHLVGASGEPVFENGWVNYHTDWAPARFFIDCFGRVHIEGLIKSGTLANICFTLPVGFRPAKHMNFACASAAGPCAVDVYSSGGVLISAAGSATWTSLDNIDFEAVTPARPAAWSGSDWPLKVSTRVQAPSLVLVAGVQDIKDPNLNFTQGPVQVDWEPHAQGLIIKSMFGLTPGRSYRVTLLITGA